MSTVSSSQADAVRTVAVGHLEAAVAEVGGVDDIHHNLDVGMPSG